MAQKLVTIFGGTGFVGRNLVGRLARDGWMVRVATRRPSRAHVLQPLGEVGQITAVRALLQDKSAVLAAVEGSQAVVNLVGLLYERGDQNFAAVHVDGARHVAEAAAEAGVTSLVQVSAIGADLHGTSDYSRSKAAGEAAVTGAFPEATILRPSIIFGPGDGFFELFATLARLSPVLPLIGGGSTRFQPVYVGNVTEAVARAIASPAARGQVYELGGPQVYSFKELLQLLLKVIDRRRLLVPLPFFLARLEAAVLECLPVPLLTRDQLRSLEVDNVVSESAKGLADLGIEATAAEVIIPTYLERHRPGGHFHDAYKARHSTET